MVEWKEGPVQPALAAAQAEAWLEGHAATAAVLLATSRTPFSVAVSSVMLPTVSDLRRKKPGMERSGPAPTPGGSVTEGVPTASAQRR